MPTKKSAPAGFQTVTRRLFLGYSMSTAKWHSYGLWGRQEGKKEIKKTMRQRAKERIHPKGPSLPGGTPYTLMMASSMCVFVCVCLLTTKKGL